MSPEDNKTLIRQGIEALNQRAMERYFAMYAPTCIFYEPPSEPFGSVKASPADDIPI